MLTSREEVLNAVKASQPDFMAAPDISFFSGDGNNVIGNFIETLSAIGGMVITVKNIGDIKYHVLTNMGHGGRNITTVPLLGDVMEIIDKSHNDVHSLQNVENAIIEAHFAVAENGAVWVTEDILKLRVLPFICQHLAVIVNARDIVPTMHEAYNRIGNAGYDFGTFIAGPSKTADIEQSLVLGAHGPRSMTIFLIEP